MDISRPDLKVKKQRRQRWTLAGIAVAVVALAVWSSQLKPAAPSVNRASVWMDAVQRGEMLREVRGPGVLVPTDTRWVAAESAARVERVLVKPGAVVAEDTVILQLSNPELSDQLLAARAEVAAAEADLVARQVELENQALDLQAQAAGSASEQQSAQLQADAEEDMARKGVVSKLQARRSRLSADLSATRMRLDQERVANFRRNMAAQLAAERARLAQLGNTLALRERQAQALDVRAGLAGVLQLIAVEAGQQVAVGANLARVARPDVLMAELRIAETQAKDLRLGLDVRVDTRNGIVPGTISRIDPAVSGGTVQVDVALNGPLPAGARPDLSVDGTIQIERLDDVLYVGRPAFAAPDSVVQLFVMNGANEAVQTRVRFGRASVSSIEILEGLKVGDQVLLSDTSQWANQPRIRLQ